MKTRPETIASAKIHTEPTPLKAIRLNDGKTGLPKNPRLIKDSRFKSLCESIQTDPQMMEARPIIVDETGVILAGNMRYRAAQSLEIDPLPAGWVATVRGWTQEQKRRFVLKDNNSYGEFDWKALATEWSADDLLQGGFTEGELRKLLDDDGKEKDSEPKIDKMAELQAEWGTAIGQVWQAGCHRIMCGDSTDPGHVALLLDGAMPGLMVTDPPYGVNYDPEWRIGAMRQKGGATGKVYNDDRADWREAWKLFPGDVAYIWHGSTFTDVVVHSIEAAGFQRRILIVWAKDRIVISRGNYHYQHETCWYAVRKGKNAQFTENRTQSTIIKNIDDVLRPGELVFFAKDQAKKIYAIRGDQSALWEIPINQKNETGHSTQKPVECMLRPIRNHTFSEVYEPFLGSGTTVIAAEQAQKKCYAMELSPEYMAVSLQRYKDATGITPKLIRGA